jgi:CRISPR/Cas system-associated exonuclease Cas4 (RecB family)
MIYSYSSIATFKQCPAKFKFNYIDRVEVDEPPRGPALERGTKIHDSVEAYFNGESEYLHPDIHANYGQFMHSIRESGDPVRPEFKWGITWEFEPCYYDAPDCMIHGFIDLLVLDADPPKEITNYEWKTGKKYPDSHRHQAWIYATAMMCHYPDAEVVKSYITYFDQNDYDFVEYHRGMMGEYKPMLRREIGNIADEKIYPPMPSFRCRWCKFSRIHNGGPCQVG